MTHHHEPLLSMHTAFMQSIYQKMTIKKEEKKIYINIHPLWTISPVLLEHC